MSYTSWYVCMNARTHVRTYVEVENREACQRRFFGRRRKSRYDQMPPPPSLPRARSGGASARSTGRRATPTARVCREARRRTRVPQHALAFQSARLHAPWPANMPAPSVHTAAQCGRGLLGIEPVQAWKEAATVRPRFPNPWRCSPTPSCRCWKPELALRRARSIWSFWMGLESTPVVPVPRFEKTTR